MPTLYARGVARFNFNRVIMPQPVSTLETDGARTLGFVVEEGVVA